jgi:hypothetical protein
LVTGSAGLPLQPITPHNKNPSATSVSFIFIVLVLEIRYGGFRRSCDLLSRFSNETLLEGNAAGRSGDRPHPNRFLSGSALAAGRTLILALP